ncbi:MAG: ABC transporter ATP-binding protein [Bacteroidetes bacterium HGW-Bacteroidetes-17]|jgi:ABC-type lipopolysaccharide export system ATPase subunit|nr:MAG: ABC transporter ATP-binding protein [Bacteroidetes bacterium HGW-Bacteroidetes-17]
MGHTLEVDSIILEFGTKRVLQDVFLKNETGKITGILGRNGAGKTCLMNIVYGEIKTNDKSIRLDGKAFFETYRNPEILRYLPQFGFIPRNLKIKRIFKDFGLNFSQFIKYFPEFEKYYNVKLKKLSGGENRIVEIYSILASKTKFCMLDEPFSQVMPLHVDTIKSIMNKEKENKGIIITDHLYEHIIDTCDDIYVITNGKTYLTKDKSDLITLGYINKN